MARTRSESVALLAQAFPRQEVSAETAKLYLRELADIDPDLLERAARVLVRTNEFFPTVRAIREAAAELTLDLPGDAEALAQVDALVAWARADPASRPESPPTCHEAVSEALKGVGGAYEFRAATNASVVRGQFLRLYRDGRARRIREAQVGDAGRALPPGEARRELEPGR